MTNLLRDAQFYDLDRLVKLLNPIPLAVEAQYRVYVGVPSSLVFHPLTRVAVRRGCPTGQVQMDGSYSIYLKEECNFISIGLRLTKSPFRFSCYIGIVSLGGPYMEVF